MNKRFKSTGVYWHIGATKKDLDEMPWLPKDGWEGLFERGREERRRIRSGWHIGTGEVIEELDE